jgi:hypothetical protein
LRTALYLTDRYFILFHGDILMYITIPSAFIQILADNLSLGKCRDIGWTIFLDSEGKIFNSHCQYNRGGL